MDVERIQKINVLALDLLKKGLASDREAAVAQAEQIYRGQGANAEEYSSFQKRFQETHQSGGTASTVSTAQADLSQEQVKDILQQNTNFLVKKIREFQEKIESLEKELVVVKNQALSSRVVVREVPAVHETQSSGSSASAPSSAKTEV